MFASELEEDFDDDRGRSRARHSREATVPALHFALEPTVTSGKLAEAYTDYC